MKDAASNIVTFKQLFDLLGNPGPHALASGPSDTEYMDSFKTCPTAEDAVIWANAEQAKRRTVYFVPHVCRPGTGRNGIVTTADVERFVAWIVYHPVPNCCVDLRCSVERRQKFTTWWRAGQIIGKQLPPLPLSVTIDCGSGVAVFGLLPDDVRIATAEYKGICDEIDFAVSEREPKPFEAPLLYLPVPFGKNYCRAFTSDIGEQRYPAAAGILCLSNFVHSREQLEHYLKLAAARADKVANAHQLELARARSIPPLVQEITKLLQTGLLPMGEVDRKRRIKVQRGLLQDWLVERCRAYPAGLKLPTPADVTGALALYVGVACSDSSGSRSYLFPLLASCRATAEAAKLVEPGTWENLDAVEWRVSAHLQTANAATAIPEL